MAPPCYFENMPDLSAENDAVYEIVVARGGAGSAGGHGVMARGSAIGENGDAMAFRCSRFSTASAVASIIGEVASILSMR